MGGFSGLSVGERGLNQNREIFAVDESYEIVDK